MSQLLRKRWLLAGIVLLVAATAGVCWVFLQAEQAKNMHDPARARARGQPIPVRTAQVTNQDTDWVIGATATTVPSDTALLRISIASRKPSEPLPDMIVKAKHIVDGEFVSRGKVLFELEDKVYRDIVEERKVELVALKAELVRVQKSIPVNLRVREQDVESAKEELALRKDEVVDRKQELDILEKLYKGNSVGAVEWLEAKVKYAQSKFSRAEAGRHLERANYTLAYGNYQDQADLTRAQSGYDKGKIDLVVAQDKVKMCQVKSPLEGFATKVDVVPGQLLDDKAVLAEVVKLDPIHVLMDFPQERTDEIVLGQKAEVVLDSFPKETYIGKVIRILPQVNTKLRILPVIIELKNPKYRIKSGVSGFVRLHQGRKYLSVPAQAVLQHGSKMMVFKVEKGRARIREVQTGPAVPNGMVEVRHGLDPGDEVVVFHDFYLHSDALTTRNCYLQDNDLIDTDWRQWTRRE